MTANHQKAREVSAQDTEETWDVPKEAVAREGAGPVVQHKGGFVVLRLLVGRSHLVCVPLVAFRPGETQSSTEGGSAAFQDEKC